MSQNRLQSNMKGQQDAQQEGQGYPEYGIEHQNSRSRTVLSRYGSAQTLAMGPEVASTPGDSTVAFPSPNECDAQQPSQDEQQYSARQYKPSAPPTGPSSTAELIPPRPSPCRAAPGWLLLLDRHWNPLVCLWTTLSLLCIFVLIAAVPTEPLQPAGAAMGMNTIRLQAEGCASSQRPVYTTSQAKIVCWNTTTNSVAPSPAPAGWSTTTLTHGNESMLDPYTDNHHQPQAQPHKPHLSREHLCLLLVALTLLLLPLPGYILVAGCWWARLGQHHKKMKQSKATRVAPQLVKSQK